MFALRTRNNFFTRSTLGKNPFASFSTAEKPLVTITGLDGFVGPHTALEFIKDGNYRVRATVRKNADEGKMSAIKDAYGSDFDKLEIVEAELLDEGSMMNAIAGSTYVAHLASPYYLDNKTRDELVKPAVNGTLGVMKACTAHGV